MDIATLDAQIQKLSPRQMEIAALLVQGRTGVDIATILSISRSRVNQHIYKMCRKTGVENRVQLIVLIAQWQLVQEMQSETL